MGLLRKQVGSEQSTNSRWWIPKFRRLSICRLDLNHPPTPVGGILAFSHNLFREVVLTSSGVDRVIDMLYVGPACHLVVVTSSA